MRGSPHLLQIWLLAHIRPFCSSHLFSYIADERSLIERLVPVIPPPEHSFSEWRCFWRELTLARFLWVARWNPGGPMITGCPGIVGVSLLSHLGSTLIFPGRDGGRGSRRCLQGSQPFGPDSLTPAGVLPAYFAALPTHLPPPASSRAPLPPASPTAAATNDQARIAALEGTVNQMATNMVELLALLRGPNRASSSSTPPPGPGPAVDPTPWAPSTQAPENVEAPAPPTLYTSPVRPFTSQLPPPPAPSVVPLPPATFLSLEHILSAPPPVSIPTPAMAYSVPPPMAPLPINTTFHEPGTPTHAAQFASSMHFFPEADAEQERRLKRMEETIRALQAGDARPDVRHGDGSLFPDMRLPPKLKIPEFKTYEGTTDPCHHLRHYRGKMLQYWEYEEFVIHSF
ncbi:hypothetical protein CRG98_012210 [Punica granatum]|uniref:Extensin-like n=1 Tax=Punica granatum TaxID=22663 RepID=A0A2I0KGT4_PUNGR|nr:hypothetical protein CRG98_012210 [Punica granatum]